jgi:hypothetical protein
VSAFIIFLLFGQDKIDPVEIFPMQVGNFWEFELIEYTPCSVVQPPPKFMNRYPDTLKDTIKFIITDQQDRYVDGIYRTFFLYDNFFNICDSMWLSVNPQSWNLEILITYKDIWAFTDTVLNFSEIKLNNRSSYEDYEPYNCFGRSDLLYYYIHANPGFTGTFNLDDIPPFNQSTLYWNIGFRFFAETLDTDYFHDYYFVNNLGLIDITGYIPDKTKGRMKYEYMLLRAYVNGESFKNIKLDTKPTTWFEIKQGK